MPSGTSSSSAMPLRRLRSWALVILREMPPPRAVFGISTRIAAGERQIGGQRRALVAALLLDDLDQQHLPALDHFLNLVLAAQPLRPPRHLLQRVAADLFDRLAVVLRPLLAARADALLRPAFEGGHFLFVFAVVVAALVVGVGRLGRLVARPRPPRRPRRGFAPASAATVSAGARPRQLRRAGLLDGAVGRRFVPAQGFESATAVSSPRTSPRVVSVDRRLGPGLGLGAPRRRRRSPRSRRRTPRRLRPPRPRRRLDCVLRDRGDLGNGLVLGVACARARLVLARSAMAAAAALAARLVVLVVRGQRLFLEQRLPVGDGDLIVVGVDFRKGEEAVPVAAVVDEGGLQRRLHARHLCEIDVAAQRPLACRFEVELLDAVTS